MLFQLGAWFCEALERAPPNRQFAASGLRRACASCA